LRLILLFILLVTFSRATLAHQKIFSPNLTPVFQESKSIYYKLGILSIRGFMGKGSVQLYSIIGNKITDIEVQDLSEFNLQIDLRKNNMYVIRVINNSKIKTFKIIVD
tara:strand:- start:1822 stop:2145 length:324 start_codon:yes stop_codon:yes gene_type:complete